MKNAFSFLTKKHLYLALVRYILSLGMLPYALSKIFQTQFVLSGFSLAEPESLEFMNTKTLAWAFWLGDKDHVHAFVDQGHPWCS